MNDNPLTKQKFAHHLLPWSAEEWPEALDAIGEIGYRGVEAFYPLFERFGAKTELARQELDMRRLTLLAMEEHADLADPTGKGIGIHAFLPLLAFCREMKAEKFVVTTGSRHVWNSMAQDFTQTAHALNELGKCCLDHDLYLCVLPQTGTRMETEEEMDRLLNLIDTREVFLCLDTAQLHKAEANPARIIEIYGECLQHIRFQDVVPEENDDPEIPECCELGEGILDFNSITRALRNKSYGGWVSVILNEETPHAKKDSAELSYSVLQSL